MEDMAQKLQNILSDEKSMQQLSELAAMLGLSDGSSAAGSGAQDFSEPSSPVSAFSNASNTQAPKDMQTPDSGIDVGALMNIASKLRNFNPEDDNIRFLIALKPLLGEEKRVRVDRAVKVLRLLNILPLIKDSGIIGGDLLGII